MYESENADIENVVEADLPYGELLLDWEFELLEHVPYTNYSFWRRRDEAVVTVIDAAYCIVSANHTTLTGRNEATLHDHLTTVVV